MTISVSYKKNRINCCSKSILSFSYDNKKSLRVNLFARILLHGRVNSTKTLLNYVFKYNNWAKWRISQLYLLSTIFTRSVSTDNSSFHSTSGRRGISFSTVSLYIWITIFFFFCSLLLLLYAAPTNIILSLDTIWKGFTFLNMHWASSIIQRTTFTYFWPMTYNLDWLYQYVKLEQWQYSI